MRNPITAVAFAAILTSSTAAIAASDDFAKIDANSDGMVTLEEGMAMHSDWTDDAFKALDLDGNGSLNAEEYAAAASDSDAAPAATTTDTKPAASAEGSTTMAAKTMRKDGPATYIETAGETDVMASTLIGMRVYAVEADIDDTKSYPAESRKEWNDIGEVNDVVLDWNGGTKAVVLGIGGFLGIGEKDVAVDMGSLRKVREADDAGDWFLVVNASKATLESAPTYKRMTN
jgi:hypothetical protein